MVNMKRIAIALLVSLMSFGAAFAHEGFEHVRGTVTQITETSLTVQTSAKQTKTVTLQKDTTFVKSGATAALKDLKVGDRVVVEAVMKGQEIIGKTVKFGSSAAKAPAKKQSQP
jgi:hypothetical protein